MRSSVEIFNIRSRARRVVWQTEQLVEAPNWSPDGTFLGGPFQPQPVQPTHTDQFGTYYIRAPWK